MSNVFNIVSKGGTELVGWDVENYLAFEDAPAEKSFLASVLKNFILGALVTVALVGLSIATGGVAATVFAGAATATVVMTVQALLTGESKSTAEAPKRNWNRCYMWWYWSIIPWWFNCRSRTWWCC